MELSRRQLVAAAGGTAVGGVLVGNALWDDDLPCPEPDAYAWDAGDADELDGFPYDYWGPPVVDDDAVYVTRGHGITAGGSGTVARLDRETGGVSWVVDREPAGVGTPAVADGVVYVPTGRNELLALAASDGAVRWRVDADDHGYESGDSFALDEPVPTDEGVVVQAFEGATAAVFDGEHAVAGVDAADGTLRWTHSLPSRCRVVGVDDGDVVAASQDGSVGRLNGRTGDVEWRLSLAGGVTDVARSVEGGVMPVVLDGHVLGGLDVEAGELDWRERVAPEPRENTHGSGPDPAEGVQRMAASADHAFAATASGDVVAVDRGSGERRWRYDAGAPAVAVTADAGREVVVALDARGFAHVLALDDGARTARLATAAENYGDTCGHRVREDHLPRWFVTLRDGSAYVASHGVRRYDLP
ncbi:PQQ-binding-like beta-propeller repeat protein [Halorubellus sp. PRR65]|uniref:outer membrane protein assembly factor BamB family protein n=1 Tax=Halorubellus sp. PRR65 TaxID=3098148 RepID=UPI002B25ED3D|nr:PQQ-binding-like beta-propeller repeat protein [Halorubellus sp. PRR65]